MTSQFSRQLLAGALCLSGLGCGPEDDPASPNPSDGVENSVVLGTGQAEFAPLEGEPELTLVAGIQGGFHVWASFRAYGFSTPVIGMVLTTTVEDVPGARIVMRANLTTREVSDPEGEAARSFAGFPAQIYDARCANGRRIRLDLRLIDADGTMAEDTRHCIALVAPELRSPNCP